MKFLFVENRYKTYFWEALAEAFLAQGHQVSWIVQNHAFTPRVGRVNVIPYPRFHDLRRPRETAETTFIRSTDRSINYLGGNDRHYEYYRTAIDTLLGCEKPDVVIGEASLFHELMTVGWCKRNGVPFLHPSMPGYPSGRFCIYGNDTKQPLGESSDLPSDADCGAMVDAIRTRKAIPDYMRAPPESRSPRAHPAHDTWKDIQTILFAYAEGERYNTTPPWRRLARPIGLKARVRLWEALATKRTHLRDGGRYVLFPMQMQPESNLDVWGNRYRDQAALIGRLADALPSGHLLFVKVNPKTKYEMSNDLLRAVRSRPNVVPLPIATPMAEVLPGAAAVATVTGTIGVEAVLSRIPVAQLGPSITDGCVGSETLADPESLGELVERIDSGRFRVADTADSIALVRKLYRTSYAGRVSDPSILPNVCDGANVALVASGVLQVSRAVTAKSQRGLGEDARCP